MSLHSAVQSSKSDYVSPFDLMQPDEAKLFYNHRKHVVLVRRLVSGRFIAFVVGPESPGDYWTDTNRADMPLEFMKQTFHDWRPFYGTVTLTQT